MANSNAPMFTAKIHTQSTEAATVAAWTPSGTTTTNLLSVFTAGTNGSRVNSIIISTTDTAAVNCFIVQNAGGAAGTLSIVGQVNVPITSGTLASIVSTDALSSTVTVGLPIDNNGKRFIHMQANDILYVGVTSVTMTSGKLLFINVMGEDY